jgi:triacylglycerol lipase
MSQTLVAKESVVLLHGLARSSRSMTKIESSLKERGYEVLNIGYPSRKFPIEQLSLFVQERIQTDAPDAKTIHFVTHSMGGIILRHLQRYDPIENLGRVVMLSPPNQGSEVVDKLGALRIFDWLNGPAGKQLGASENNLLKELGPVDFELGVITGDRSINWILSSMIQGKDDGKVSIESAKISGMKDFKIVHASHPFIMRKNFVIQDILNFLESGTFARNPKI